MKKYQFVIITIYILMKMAYSTKLLASALLFCLVIQGDGARLKRLVGAEDAQPSEIFYQASLRVDTYHACGAIIISDKHILTAAHCLANLFVPPYDDLVVVTGATSLKDGNLHKVFNVTWHKDHVNDKENVWFNDIGIVTLRDRIKVNQYQAPIRLPTSPAPLHREGVISGFGATDGVNHYLSNGLQKAKETVISREECQTYVNHTIPDGQICGMAKKGVGLCQGDSGGPFVVDGTLVGIASWNFPCGKGDPDGFTDVYHYLDYIKKVVDEN